MKPTIELKRTIIGRTGDTAKPIINDHSAEQEARVKALQEKFQEEYFDSGLHYKEMHKAQGGSVND